jgi:predicted small lipoprotein YifL
MRLFVALALVCSIAGCGQRDPGTASEAEAEALNKAAAELETQIAPIANSNGQ